MRYLLIFANDILFRNLVWFPRWLIRSERSTHDWYPWWHSSSLSLVIDEAREKPTICTVLDNPNLMSDLSRSGSEVDSSEAGKTSNLVIVRKMVEEIVVGLRKRNSMMTTDKDEGKKLKWKSLGRRKWKTYWVNDISVWPMQVPINLPNCTTYSEQTASFRMILKGFSFFFHEILTLGAFINRLSKQCNWVRQQYYSHGFHWLEVCYTNNKIEGEYLPVNLYIKWYIPEVQCL